MSFLCNFLDKITTKVLTASLQQLFPSLQKLFFIWTLDNFVEVTFALRITSEKFRHHKNVKKQKNFAIQLISSAINKQLL